MGNYRPLPIKCWAALLAFLGYKLDRIKGSHHQWTKAKSRTIAVWGDEKEIPAMHLKTSCSSFGWTLADVYAWSEKHC